MTRKAVACLVSVNEGAVVNAADREKESESMETVAWTAVVVFGILGAALVLKVRSTLNELEATLRTYREMEPTLRRVAANVEEITRQVTVQTARVDNITAQTKEMVASVGKTVELYNRAVARPAVLLAGLGSGVRTAANVFFGKKKSS
ncbi:MAG: hypothetical protein D6679_09005 [Candidatus Hydrogenedentota bacterium]|nr:MAG: hypothetical protein D6679_09005 [Candidatus Hydrogenedentota bacterium]